MSGYDKEEENVEDKKKKISSSAANIFKYVL